MATAPMTTGTILNITIWCLCSLATATALCGSPKAEQQLYQSRQATRAGEYTFGIEGPAVDSAGNLYVVNFQRPGTIGRLRPGSGASEIFTTLPEGSIGNSIRFGSGGPAIAYGVFGQNTIEVIALDTAGNASPPATTTLFIP